MQTPPSFYTLDASSTPPQVSQTKLSPTIAKCHVGAKVPSVENHCTGVLEFVLFTGLLSEAVTVPDT